MSQKDGGGQVEEGENEKDEKQMHSHKNTDDLSDDGEYFEKDAEAPKPKPKKAKKQVVIGYITKDGRFLLGKYVRETLVYLIFLVAFTYTQVMGRNSDRVISYTNMWRTILQDRSAGIIDHLSFYDFLNKTVANEIFKPDYFESRYYSASSDTGHAKLRQLRVKAAYCHTLHNKLVAQGTIKSEECYPSWPGADEEKTYSKQGAKEPDFNDKYGLLEYVSHKATKEPEFQGKFGEYHGGGFQTTLTVTNAKMVIEDIHKLLWVDPKTRAVFLEFLVYSKDDDLFANIRLAMEFVPGGVVLPTVDVYAFVLDRYPEGTSVKIGLEFLVYIMVVLYVIDEYLSLKQQGWSRYMKIDWPLLDNVNYILFIVGGAYKILYLRTMFALAEADSQLSPEKVSFQLRETAVDLAFQDQLSGANGFLLWLKTFKYVMVTERLLRLGNTLASTILDVVTFGFLFAVIAYAFAVGGHVLFARELEEFGTVNSAARTMLRAVFGEALFPRLMQAAGLSGYFYLLTWLMISKTILLNIVISILHEAYQAVLAQEASKPIITTWMRLLAEVSRRKIEAENKAMEEEERKKSIMEGRAGHTTGNVEHGDRHALVRERLGWKPPEEAEWQPYGTNGASPPRKKNNTKKKK